MTGACCRTDPQDGSEECIVEGRTRACRTDSQDESEKCIVEGRTGACRTDSQDESEECIVKGRTGVCRIGDMYNTIILLILSQDGFLYLYSLNIVSMC